MATLGDTVTTGSAALKEYYVDDVCKPLYFKENPAFAMVRKDTAWGGKSYLRIPFIWGVSGGISTDFSAAQATAAATFERVSEVQIARAKTHSIGYIDNELIRATKNDAKAFIRAVKTKTDALVTNLGRDLEIAFFRDGYGYRGRLSSTQTLSSSTITLAQASDAYNFEVGQRYDVTAAVGSTAAAKAYGSSGNPLIVTATDTDAGTVTFGYAINDATNGIPTIAVSDYLMLKGDVGTSAANGYRPKPCGLLGWCPDAAPSSGESFYGLDRSVSNRLYGQRLDLTTGANINLSLIEGINKGVGKAASYGGRLNRGFCSWTTYEDVINSMEAKVFVEREVMAGIGFRGVKIVTPKGDVELYPSIGCDDAHLWLVDMSNIALYTLDDAVQISDEDGFEMVRAYNADASEIRYKSMGNYGCSAPGASIVNIKVR